MNSNQSHSKTRLDAQLHLQSVLNEVGLRPGQQVLLHAAFRRIRSAFPGLRMSDLIQSLQKALTPSGSLIMPAFSYCFKKKSGISKIYQASTTPSEVGAVSEYFRQLPEVNRTSSATHSFALWGKVQSEIAITNSPRSPLGEGSVLEWLTSQSDSFILGLGIDFSAVSYCHYLEIQAGLPWIDIFPWDFMKIEKKGVSVLGEQSLVEVPGCSKAFVNFEKYLLQKKVLKPFLYQGLYIQYIPVKLLHDEGMIYFKRYPEKLLCPPGKCQACDIRHKLLRKSHNRTV